MACLNILKQEIRAIESTFPRQHERFQVLSATVDELTCRFIDNKGKKHEIHGNITETYPNTPPVWFCDTDDPTISAVLEHLSNTNGKNNHIIEQVRFLVSELCLRNGLSEPLDLKCLHLTHEGSPYRGYSESVPTSSRASSGHGSCSGDNSSDEDNADDESDRDEDLDEEDVEIHIDFEEPTAITKKSDGDIGVEHLSTLERLKQNQREDYLRGAVTGSVQATDRLMKELRDIYKSDTFKKRIYTVELVNDNLYEWDVKMFSVDSESPLMADLALLKEREGKDYIQFRFVFKDNYPFEPPFVHIVAPIITGGYVLVGGAICMELLTKQGWCAAYNVESVIMQIAATLVKGKARIQFGPNKNQYSLARAQQSFKSLVQIHEKNGWYTPPKEDG
ncbi:ubiquitin-conjugating enzyme E2 Q2-like [Artemia franciscana]